MAERTQRALIAASVASLSALSVLGLQALAGGPSWEAHPTSPLGRTEVGAGRAGPHIWVVGGFGSGAAPSAEVRRFDPRTGDWKVAPDLPVALNHSGVFGWHGRPYVMGGFLDVPLAGSGRASPRLFRLKGGQWKELTPAPVGRSAFALGRIGSRVYVAGGAAGTQQSSTRVDVYDLRGDRWRSGPALKVAREHLAGAVAGKRGSKFFYAIGGRDFYGGPNYRTVERLNPRTGRWRHVAETAVGHAGFGAAGFGRQVVAVGGEAPGSSALGTIPTAEIYRPRADRWRPLPDMPTPRHGFGFGIVRGTAWTLEGGTITLVGISNIVESLRLRR